MSRVKTPTVLQMEAVECGAASLGIVLGYFGRYVPLEELRLACGVSRDGSRASNIAKAARRYGLVAKAYKREPEGLKSLPLPLIVYWNFNHFLVVEGFGKTSVLLNDPATGPRTVSYPEFDKSFTGVVLVLEPGPDFVKSGARPGLLGTVRNRLRGFEVGLTYVILASLALVVPGLVVALLTRLFVDNILVRSMHEWMGAVLAGMGLAVVLRATLTWLQQRYLLRLETKLALTTSSQFFWHVLRLPMEFYTQRYAGEIGARVALNDRVAQLLSGQLATAVLDAISIVFYLILMLRFSAGLTVIGVSFSLLNLVALRYVARKRVDANQRIAQERGKLMGTSMSGLQMIETLKATGRESDFFSRWAGYQARLVNAEQEMATYTQVLAAVPPLLTALTNAVILGVGGLRIMQGGLTVGMLVAFQFLMTSFIEPINRLVGLGSSLQEVESDLKRLDDVLDYETDPQLASESLAADLPPKLAGYLEVKDLCFGYSRLDPPLVEKFSLTLTPGSRVALVGGSGSGKSTVGRLVTGLLSPWEGQILFDGRPREHIPRAIINHSLAMVDQDIFLFEGTVKENLSLWDRTVAEASIVQAAKDACIHEEITARPGAYETRVEEGGANFSGGQRQRLEIARALAGNPTLLVLDEATSALDPITEKLIDDNLRQRGCTCLIVAHRLSTIRDCDEIIVLERGKIAQRGTHDQLRGVEGPYSRLMQMEVRKAKPHLDFA